MKALPVELTFKFKTTFKLDIGYKGKTQCGRLLLSVSPSTKRPTDLLLRKHGVLMEGPHTVPVSHSCWGREDRWGSLHVPFPVLTWQ